MYTKDDTTKNAQLAIIATACANGSATARTGSRPASPQDAATGTLLITWSLDSTPFAAPSGGSMVLADTPVEALGAADGTIGYIRFRRADNSGVVDLTVTAAGGGGDLIATNLVIATGQLARLLPGITLHG